jgi:hypothetical protein
VGCPVRLLHPAERTGQRSRRLRYTQRGAIEQPRSSHASKAAARATAARATQGAATAAGAPTRRQASLGPFRSSRTPPLAGLELRWRAACVARSCPRTCHLCPGGGGACRSPPCSPLQIEPEWQNGAPVWFNKFVAQTKPTRHGELTSAQRTRLHPGRGRARAGREMGAANGAMMGREQRQRRIMARMPDEVAEVMERRLEHRELKEKINYEAAMFKRQENFDEFTNNPVHHMLGLGRKPPPKQPDEESSAESWFMKKKIAERDKLDWEDPVKKAMRRTDACEDQGKHLIKLTCNYATGPQRPTNSAQCEPALQLTTCGSFQDTRSLRAGRPRTRSRATLWLWKS